MQWEPKHLRAFISHVSKEKVFASNISVALEAFGIDGFVAHNDIQPSAAWRAEITEAIRTCNVFVLLLHEGFPESNWCDQETGIAHAFGKKMVPVRLASLQPYGFANDFQALDCRAAEAAIVARKIFDTVVNDEGDLGSTQRRALVAYLGESRSFMESAERAREVNRVITVWDTDLLERLESTLRNDQVSNGGVASAVVREILTKYADDF